NTDMYRRLLALSMLRVAESDYNVTGVTLVDIFSNAERYSMSTSGLFSNEVPSPIDITPPVITSSAVGSATYSGVLNYPVIVNDLLDIKRIDYSIDGNYLSTEDDLDNPSLTIDTTAYADGDHVLTVEAWDILDNYASQDFALKF